MWYKSLHIQRKLFLLIIAAPLLCVTLSGCSLPGSFFNGNDTADIDEAIRITQEQYGIKLTLQKKLIPGGAACNVKVRCEELPGVDISIFRFDENSSVISDYIFQKYGEEAYDAICAVVGDALPGSRVLVDDFQYGHRSATEYDKNTTLGDYLLDNKLRVNVIIGEEYSSEKLKSVYRDVANKLIDAGINCYEFSIYCTDSPETAEGIRNAANMKESEHIPKYARRKTLSALLSDHNA